MVIIAGKEVPHAFPTMATVRPAGVESDGHPPHLTTQPCVPAPARVRGALARSTRVAAQSCPLSQPYLARNHVARRFLPSDIVPILLHRRASNRMQHGRYDAAAAFLTT